MRLFRFDAASGQPLTHYGSHHVRVARVLSTCTLDGVVCMHLEPGGIIARHKAVENQLYLVVQGQGWVSGDSGERVAIHRGQAAFWVAGEEHTSGTDSGMTAIVLEGKDISPIGLMPEMPEP